MEKSRYLGLDLARFFAALVVALGHLLFSESLITEWSLSQRILSPFRFGSLSVAFFFTLSGFVLAPQIESIRQKPMRWIQARLTRLLPLYYFSWFFPLLFFIALAQRNGGPLFPNGLESAIWGLFASQSWTGFYLDLPNPPLWSLSVEVYLSLLLVLLSFTIRNLLVWVFLTLVCFIFTIIYFENLGPVLGSIHYFLLGILISESRVLKFAKKRMITLLLFLSLIPTFYPILTQVLLNQQSRLDFPCKSIFCCISILLLANVKLPDLIKTISNFLGQRSYSLYATHFPILVFFTQIFPSSRFLSPWIYIILVVSLLVISTEFAYQFIDRPSLEFSRRLRKFSRC